MKYGKKPAPIAAATSTTQKPQSSKLSASWKIKTSTSSLGAPNQPQKDPQTQSSINPKQQAGQPPARYPVTATSPAPGHPSIKNTPSLVEHSEFLSTLYPNNQKQQQQIYNALHFCECCVLYGLQFNHPLIRRFNVIIVSLRPSHS